MQKPVTAGHCPTLKDLQALTGHPTGRGVKATHCPSCKTPILAGLDHARPDLHVTDHLTQAGKRSLDLARSQCNGEVSTAMRSVAPGDLQDSSLGDERFVAALADYTRVPTGGYTVPIRIDHGLLDPVVPFPLTATLVRSMQADGTDVDLHTHTRADHTDVVADSLDQVMGTAAAAFGRD